MSSPAIDKLTEALDALIAEGGEGVGDGESLLALLAQFNRFDAAITRGVAAFDESCEWRADGARTAAWLAAKSRGPASHLKTRVRVGRALRHLPVVEQAWLDGEIGGAHAWLFARARTKVTEAALARDEEMLVDQARQFPFNETIKVLDYWYQHADPDGAEDDAATTRAKRRLHLSQTFEGTWAIDGWFDPISGAIINNQLAAIEREMFETDWADAKARLGGTEPQPGDLARSPAQRRADALVEMARRAAAVPAGARLPGPLITMVVGYESSGKRLCELADGTVITPGSLLAFLDDAYLERVVFGPPSRVIDVGVRQRLFTGATRRAIEVRDRACYHPMCDVSADRCQVDHIQPYENGGLTTQDNGRLACGVHNRLRQRRPPPPSP